MYLCPDRKCFHKAARRRLPPTVTRRGCGPALAEIFAAGADQYQIPKGVR